MVTAKDAYGGLIRIDPAGPGREESLRRIPVGTPKSQGGIDESTLQDLLFRHPKSLPIAAIDAAYDGIVPVCRELSTPAGYLDALYANALGRLTLVEFKLWRNPQARREVIGQILDYAKELASWRYEDLQREVSKCLNAPGNALYERVRAVHPDVDETQFVDNVARHRRLRAAPRRSAFQPRARGSRFVSRKQWRPHCAAPHPGPHRDRVPLRC